LLAIGGKLGETEKRKKGGKREKGGGGKKKKKKKKKRKGRKKEKEKAIDVVLGLTLPPLSLSQSRNQPTIKHHK